ncbi:MAG: MFS transporter [Chloroflexi bacterium]|nr:MFS transporter [Chloroflexota bacterium]
MDRRRLIILIAVVFSNILGASAILPTLPIYAQDQYGASSFQAIILNGAFFGAQFIGAPILGRLSDRLGRRPVLIVSQLGTVMAFIMFAVAGQLADLFGGFGMVFGVSGGLAVLFSARILDGLTGGNISVARAYIADVSDDENRARALGLVQAAFGVAFVLGPAFGGFLSNEINVQAPFIAAAIITGLTVLSTILFLPESLPPEDRSNRDQAQERQIPLIELVRAKPLFGLILLIGFFETSGFASVQNTFAVFADDVIFPDLSTGLVNRNIGLIFSVVGIVLTVTQGVLIAPLVKRFGEKWLVFGGQLFIGLSFLALALSANPWIATLFLGIFAFGRGIAQPSEQALVTRFGDKRTQGRMLGLYQSAFSLALAVAPIWNGIIYQQISPQAVWWAAVVLAIPTAMLAFYLAQQSLPQAQTNPSLAD